MNQKQLISYVASLSSLRIQQVEDALKTAGDVIASALADGVECVLPGLGKLSVKRREARQGRNPKTGETIKIPAKRSVSFRAGKALKDAIGKLQ